MFASLFFNLVLPLAFTTLRGYMNSTASDQDGKVLDAVKESVNYLADKDNNTLCSVHSNAINKTDMIEAV